MEALNASREDVTERVDPAPAKAEWGVTGIPSPGIRPGTSDNTTSVSTPWHAPHQEAINLR